MTHNKGLVEISDVLLHELLKLPYNWRLTGDIDYDAAYGVWRLNVIGSDIPDTKVGQLLPHITGIVSITTHEDNTSTETMKWSIS